MTLMPDINSLSVSTKQARIYYLDFGKIFACFLVVLGHLYSGGSTINKFLYGFHLPFFFLISGVFHHNCGHIQWRKYVKTLIVPALFFMALEAVYSVICLFVFLQSADLWQELLNIVKYYCLRMIISTGLGPYWFLFALFWCKVFCDYMSNHNKVVCTILWLLCLSFPVIFRIRIPLFISQGIMALPFYLTGFYFRDKLKKLYPSYLYLCVFLLSLIVTVVLSHFNGKVSMNGYMFGQLNPELSIPLFYINGAIGTAMILSITLIPFPKITYIKELGKSLITIVGFQGIPISLYSQFVGKDQSIIVSIIASCIILWFCYLFHLSFHKLYLLK